jgi:hypothetical protein
VSIYIWSTWPQMVVEHNWRLTWTHPLRKLTYGPLGSHCDDMMEPEGREPTIITPPHLSQYPNGMHEKSHCWLEKSRNRVRGYDTPWQWGSIRYQKERERTNVEEDRVRTFIVWFDEMEMRWCLSTLGFAEYIFLVTLSTPLTPIYQ